ncbi:MFS transporter [Desulfobulbus alkaliphilus]|uniref:MFS transporter n=1 Tax=Desulfobulbus alkaliphilus TaxID=869814 RepID=UPI00196419FF|nr:MFS transporter [Desulfobulbus alkaliphilus]MBM9535796.1 MFS transporter [Desulfobulbus alkaliphilus]
MSRQGKKDDSAVANKERIGLRVLVVISFCHFLNDMLQSLIPAIYPQLKENFDLSFTQIGLITLTYQLSASLLQPMVGLYTDLRPKPYSLTFGMGCSLLGLILLATAPGYGLLLVAVGLVGTGSAIFHPESSRVARMAAAGQYGLAQSIFQVGGNAGTAMGPLLAALIIIPHGRHSLAWFSLCALLAMLILFRVGGWYRKKRPAVEHIRRQWSATGMDTHPGAGTVVWPLLILLVLIFSKFFYLASLNSYYIFYLMHTFQVSVQSGQIRLFVFLFGAALGTLLGGPVGDRIGRRRVIWWSILGVAPFTLMLPHVSLFWTGPLTFFIGLMLASAFPAIVVYAQELIPGRVGTVSGLFFGLAFGMAGIGAALLGRLADLQGIVYVYHLCSFLPLLGLSAILLPDVGRNRDTR